MHHPDHAPRSGRFDLSGGALCLDFANSWAYRGDPARDDLRDPSALLDFTEQTRISEPEQRESLSAVVDGELFERALALRELLFRIFARAARGEDVERADVDDLNTLIGEAHGALRLRCHEAGCAWDWEGAQADRPRSLLWPIVRSAAALLTGEELDRVRECDAPDCSWLFVDRSRSRQRRWCSMESCGNRAKARRHYRRKKRSDSES